MLIFQIAIALKYVKVKNILYVAHLLPPPFTFAFINISRVTYQRNNSSTKNGNPVKQEIQSWVWPIFLNCLSPCQNSSLHLHFQGNTLFWTIQMQNMKCNLISEKAPALQIYVSKNYKRKYVELEQFPMSWWNCICLGYLCILKGNKSESGAEETNVLL